MQRREMLRSIAALGTTGLLAGCLGMADDPGGNERSGGDGSPTGTPDGSPTTTDREAPDEPTDDSSTATESPDGDGGDDSSATDEAEETPAETDEGTPTETKDETATATDSAASSDDVETTFEVLGSDCGSGADRATVERGDARVAVDGTIGGRNGCDTAELERVAYEDDELTIAVRTVRDDTQGACMQCLVDIDYRATVEFDDGTPSTVRVLHDGERVTSA